MGGELCLLHGLRGGDQGGSGKFDGEVVVGCHRFGDGRCVGEGLFSTVVGLTGGGARREDGGGVDG